MQHLIEKLLLFLGRLFCIGILLAAAVFFCKAMLAGNSAAGILGVFLYISLPISDSLAHSFKSPQITIDGWL